MKLKPYSILFPSIVSLTPDEFKITISDIQTDFSSEFSLILLSRYVYHSIQAGLKTFERTRNRSQEWSYG